MADLSKIKVGNSIYDIKDIVTREKLTAMEEDGFGLDFKTCYIHAYEFYYDWGPTSNIVIYVPMDTPDLTGIDFLTQKATDYGPFPSSLYKPGMFATICEISNTYRYLTPRIAELVMNTEPDAEYPDLDWYIYRLAVKLEGEIQPTIEALTFVSETVI